MKVVFKNGVVDVATDKLFQIKCVNVGSLTSLTDGKVYQAKVYSSNGSFRVRDDNGKMSSFDSTRFEFISGSLSASPTTATATATVAVAAPVTTNIDALHLLMDKDRVNDVIESAAVDPGTISDAVKDTIHEATVNHIVKCASDGMGTEDIVKNAFALFTELLEKETNAMAEEEVKKAFSAPAVATGATKKFSVREYLVKQGVPESLVKDMEAFRGEMNADNPYMDRMPRLKKASELFQGADALTKAISAMLAGKNLLLYGEKATGKNVLANNLAFFFGLPQWTASCHTHVDAAALIGCDTLKEGSVEFREGPVTMAAKNDGMCVIDEINFAKPESSAVLHSITDTRGYADIPGYDLIRISKRTRFVATMNYGYAGTRELNEALKSRFVVINVKPLTQEEMADLLFRTYGTHYTIDTLKLFAKLFDDLRTKARNAEISTTAMDFRGLKDAIEFCIMGMKPYQAIECCIIDKIFEEHEHQLVEDTVKTLFPVDCKDVSKLISIKL